MILTQFMQSVKEKKNEKYIDACNTINLSLKIIYCTEYIIFYIIQYSFQSTTIGF